MKAFRCVVVCVVLALVGCDSDPDPDGGTDAARSDAGVDSGAGQEDAGPADAGTEDAAPTDAGIEAGPTDAGLPTLWPDEPTDLSPTPEVPRWTFDDVRIEQTAGGNAILLARVSNYGEGWWVNQREAGGWGEGRLLPGRDARLAVSGGVAAVVYASCEGPRCRRGRDVFAEVYRDGAGWSGPEQVDVAPPSAPFIDLLDQPLRSLDVVSDAAGQMLLAWQAGAGVFFREWVDGSWSAVSMASALSNGVTTFFGQGPRRYVGMAERGTHVTTVVDGDVQRRNLSGTASVRELGAHRSGDDLFLFTARGTIVEAHFNGAGFDLAVVATFPSPVALSWAGRGPRTALTRTLQESGGWVNDALLRHDTSGTGAGTYGFTEVEIARPPSGFSAMPVGVVDTDDGFVFFYWQGEAVDERSNADWSLHARRMRFGADGTPTLATPVLVAERVLWGSRHYAAGRRGHGFAAGDTIVFAYPTRADWAHVALTLRDAEAGGVEVSPSVPLGSHATHRSSEPRPGTLDGAPTLVFSEGSPTSLSFRTLTEAGIRDTLLDPPGSASVILSPTSLAFDPRDRGAFVYAAHHRSTRVPVLALYRDGATGPSDTPPRFAPAYFSYRQAFGAGGWAVAVLPESPDRGVQLHRRAPDGTWTSETRLSDADTLFGVEVVPFERGFVAVVQVLRGEQLDLVGLVHDGEAWSEPRTLAAGVPLVGEGEATVSLTRSEDGVLLIWADAQTLYGAALTTLAEGFSASRTLHTIAEGELGTPIGMAGSAGHLVSFDEPDGDGGTRLATVRWTGDVFSPAEHPIDARAGEGTVAAAQGRFVVARASSSGLDTAVFDGSTWHTETLASDGVLVPGTLMASTSQAGTRLTVSSDTGTLQTWLRGPDGWGPRRSVVPPDGYDRFDPGAMNASGDFALLLTPDGFPGVSQLGVFRQADARLERVDLVEELHSGNVVVAPNQSFVVMGAQLVGDVGAARLFVRAGL